MIEYFYLSVLIVTRDLCCWTGRYGMNRQSVTTQKRPQTTGRPHSIGGPSLVWSQSETHQLARKESFMTLAERKFLFSDPELGCHLLIIIHCHSTDHRGCTWREQIPSKRRTESPSSPEADARKRTGEAALVEVDIDDQATPSKLSSVRHLLCC